MVVGSRASTMIQACPRASLAACPREGLWAVVGVGLGVGLVVGQGLYFRWVLDDSYITFSYAKNWVEGHGLVFNVGERVEGYTCFLWVVVSALGLWLGVPIEPWSWALGIGSAALAVVVAYCLAVELVPREGRWAAALAAVVVGAYPPLAWWAASGMETALFTLLVSVAIWRHVREGAQSSIAPVCLALASMTRPDGWLVSGVLCLDALRQGSWKAGLRYVAIFLAIFGPYYGWRYWYYGYPLPNTFYAKVGTTAEQVERGWRYLQGFLWEGRGVWLYVAAAVGVALHWRRLWVVGGLIVAFTASMVVLGGDAFHFYRFFVPLVPLLGALGGAGMGRVFSYGASARAWPRVSGIALAGGLLWAFCSLLPKQEAHWREKSFLRTLVRATCQILRDETQAQDIVAAGAIGLPKFCSGRRVIDMLGLADRHIARRELPRLGQGLAGHEKYDNDYVLAQLPKFILVPKPDSTSARLPVLENLWQHPVLRQYYRPDRVGYRRVDRLSQAAAGQAR